jgi:hypothetical protein
MSVSLNVYFTARVWQNFKFWIANPQGSISTTGSCKNNETFDISFYFRDYFSPSPQLNVEKQFGLRIVCPTLFVGRGRGQRLSSLNYFLREVVVSRPEGEVAPIMPLTFFHHSLGLVCLRCMANLIYKHIVVDATSFLHFIYFITSGTVGGLLVYDHLLLRYIDIRYTFCY